MTVCRASDFFVIDCDVGGLAVAPARAGVSVDYAGAASPGNRLS